MGRHHARAFLLKSRQNQPIMSKKDIFGDDIEAKKSDFESMLDGPMGRKLSLGTTITGEIISIGKEEAFVSTGTPIDGALPMRELLDQNKELKYKVGDKMVMKFCKGSYGIYKRYIISVCKICNNISLRHFLKKFRFLFFHVSIF